MAAAGITSALFPDLPEPASQRSQPADRAGSQFPHLWLCINLPRLALETHCAVSDTNTHTKNTQTEPTVVVDGEGSHCAVYVANAMARRQGIRAGLGLNAAYALCPLLQVQQRDAALEQQQLEKLALWATQFTPWVHIVQPMALLLEVRGSLHLFAGAKGLCTQINSQLDARAHYRKLALAPTPLAALWLARAGQGTLITQPQELPGQLGKLPLHYLGWSGKTIASLQGMGVYSIRDCLRLPRDGFARRFGRRHLQQLDRALGRLPDPRASFIAPERFRKTIEMPAETTSTSQLAMAAERLLGELAQYLITRQAGIQNIGLRLFHSDTGGESLPPTPLRIGLLEDCQDAQRLLSLVRLKLESLILPAPVIALELLSGKVTTLTRRERNLFTYDSGGPPDWSGLLENLRTKLGISAVFGIASVADHRPESAWCRVSPSAKQQGQALSRGDRQIAEYASPTSRPLWLLSQPQRLSTTANRPDYDGPLLRKSGPERIETGWWDGDDVVRDYYIANNPHGLQLWIYRERRAPHDWYLHGYFG